MLESGKRSLLLEATTSALNDLAECHGILAKENGKDSEKYAEAPHEYDKTLLEWAGTERGNLEHAMGVFKLGEPEDLEVETLAREGGETPKCDELEENPGTKGTINGGEETKENMLTTRNDLAVCYELSSAQQKTVLRPTTRTTTPCSPGPAWRARPSSTP